MGVAGLGDAAASDGLAARLLARDQAEIGHELARTLPTSPTCWISCNASADLL
jgi:hypothetical protein